MQERSHRIVVSVSASVKQRIRETAAQRLQSVNTFMVVAALRAADRTNPGSLGHVLSPRLPEEIRVAIEKGPDAFYEMGQEAARSLSTFSADPGDPWARRREELQELLCGDALAPVFGWLEEHRPGLLVLVPAEYVGFYLEGMADWAKLHGLY